MKYAQVRWMTEDLTERYQISEEAARSWLLSHERSLQEAMIQAGWEYIILMIDHPKRPDYE